MLTANALKRYSAGANAEADLGRNFGADLTEAEVRYLANNEWAMTAEDIVWRRTKLGLRMSEAEIAEVDAYLGTLLAAPQAVESKGGASVA